MKARLGVNIDHVATLRQAREESYPSVTKAAREAIKAGADQITIHLRADRRHIQDFDVAQVKAVTEKAGVLLNLEFGLNEEIMDIAVQNSPDWICLVPEKREERTTEGGLNLADDQQFKDIQKACLKLKERLPKVKISLFVEADQTIIPKLKECAIDAVEIHTGTYAKLFLENGPYQKELERFESFYQEFKELGLGYHAGHGLTYDSTVPLAKNGLFAEYNIGHWIISESVFRGLAPVVSELKNLLSRS